MIVCSAVDVRPCDPVQSFVSNEMPLAGFLSSLPALCGGNCDFDPMMAKTHLAIMTTKFMDTEVEYVRTESE
jgi:hypothetical protein